MITDSDVEEMHELSVKLNQYFFEFGMGQTISEESELYCDLIELEDKLESIKGLYIKLTNSEIIKNDSGENFYIANNKLMNEFDEIINN